MPPLDRDEQNCGYVRTEAGLKTRAHERSREMCGRRPWAYLPEPTCLYIEVAVAQADVA
jgi:hypothetical protein